MSCASGVCSDSQAKKFVGALINPFGKNAIGAQVPDAYSFPTDTRFIKSEFKLYADTNGDLDFTLLPSLFQSILTGCPTGGTVVENNNTNIGAISLDSDFQINGGFVVGSSDGQWNLGGVTVPSNLASQLAKYRIVGWGARVRALTAPINQSGRLIFSSSPSNDYQLFQPSVGTVGVNTSYGDVCNYFHIPGPDLSGYLTKEMLNVPDCMQCMFSDLSLNGGMQWVSKHTSAQSLDFLNTNNSLVDTSGAELGFGLIDSTGGPNLSVIAQGSINSSDLIGGNNNGGYSIDGSLRNSNLAVTPSLFVGSVVTTNAIVTSLVKIVFSASNTPPVGITGPYIVSHVGPLPQVGWGWTYSALSTLASDFLSVTALQYTPNLGYSGKVDQVSLSTFTGDLVIDITLDSNITPVVGGDYMLKFFPVWTTPTGNCIPGGVETIAQNKNNQYPNNGYFDAYTWKLGQGGSGIVVDPAFIGSAGWSQMSCRGVGLPNNGQPAVSVEVCYHIEGPPLVSGITGGVLSGGQYPYVDQSLMDEAFDFAAKKPHFQVIPGAQSGSALTNMALN